MLAAERQKLILDYLDANTTASTTELSRLTGASPATLRRDIHSLSDQKLLKRTHGGAQKLEVTSSAAHEYPPCVNDDDPYLWLKNEIAAKAATFVQSNDIIFIGAGMTCNLLSRYITQGHAEHLTVVTTNVTSVMELSQNPNCSTLLLGGTIHVGKNHIETLDNYTVSTLEQLYFDKAFFTVDGADLNYGYSILNRAQLPLYHHLIENSKDTYLLLSTDKLDKRTFSQLCPLGSIKKVITNDNIDPKYLSYYSDHGIDVVASKSCLLNKGP